MQVSISVDVTTHRLITSILGNYGYDEQFTYPDPRQLLTNDIRNNEIEKPSIQALLGELVSNQIDFRVIY